MKKLLVLFLLMTIPSSTFADQYEIKTIYLDRENLYKASITPDYPTWIQTANCKFRASGGPAVLDITKEKIGGPYSMTFRIKGKVIFQGGISCQVTKAEPLPQ